MREPKFHTIRASHSLQNWYTTMDTDEQRRPEHDTSNICIICSRLDGPRVVKLDNEGMARYVGN